MIWHAVPNVTGIFIFLAAVTAKPEYKSPKTDPRALGSHGRPEDAKLSTLGPEAREKRTLYDYGNTGAVYPQIAARRGGAHQNGRLNEPIGTGQASANYNYNYGPYPQYIEAPEPIIEIIIKDANETVGGVNTQPIVPKTKKKKEKVHVFYVNYKKDENNKLHLESPIASLNNDDAEEEEEEGEEQAAEYQVTPLPPVSSTTLRTIIHPDSERYQGNSGIHVTFGSEAKTQKGQDLEEHDAESVQREVVAVPIAPAGAHSHFLRQDISADARSPHAPNLYQSQYSPSQHHAAFQMPLPAPAVPRQQQQDQFGQTPQTFHHKSSASQNVFFTKPPPNQMYQSDQHPRRPLSQIQHQIHQQLQQQSQYYVNHNQLYQQNHPVQTSSQQGSVFPGAPSKAQELPLRQAAQPYQPIKFRPTPANTPPTTRPAPAATKLENYNSNSRPYQFQRQPQFVQQPTFTLPSPSLSSTQYSKQQPKSPLRPYQPHLSNSQNNGQQFAQTPGFRQKAQQPEHSPYHSGPTSVKATKQTELLKSIPKFEQHITETVQNNYPFGTYQSQNQVIHDIPAPNLSPKTQQGPQQPASANGGPQPNPQYSNFVTAASAPAQLHFTEATTKGPQLVESTDGQMIMVVTPVPPTAYQQHRPELFVNTQREQQHLAQVATNVQSHEHISGSFHQQPRHSATPSQNRPQAAPTPVNSPFSVSTYHSDVFKELSQHTQKDAVPSQNGFVTPKATDTLQPSSASPTASPTASPNAHTLSQLPAEVPEDLRQQLLSSGILSNADISVLDYDKVGDIALENLPAEHLQHFYGAGGGAQISESKKVLTVLKPNGDKVSIDEKRLYSDKEPNALSPAKLSMSNVVRLDSHASNSATGNSGSAERQYNRYLPLKVNAAHFPRPPGDDLQGRVIKSVVILAPVDSPADTDGSLADNTREVKFLGGELIKNLAKKPSSDNFRRWLERESRLEVDQQSVVLLVTWRQNPAGQDIFMYDINTGELNKLNGELSSKFVSVAEENASAEDLDHGSTLDPSFLNLMMHGSSR